MSAWHERLVGELVDIFDSVRVPLSAAERETRKGTYPYYGAQGIIDYVDDYLFDGRYLLIPEDGENLNSRKLPIAYFAEGKFWVNNHAHIIRGKKGVADDVFLKHALSALNISGFITGAAQPKLTQANLRRISLLVPPLQTQRRIASILGAYDDLIEVNRRRVKLLEEMARGLFEEWFVRFRFPGYETTPLIDTHNGKLPYGWKSTNIGALLNLSVGGLWGESAEVANSNQMVAVIRGTDFPKIKAGNYTTIPNRFVSKKELQDRILHPGDIVLEASGGSKDQPVGRVIDISNGFLDQFRTPVAPASFCRLLRPKGTIGLGSYLMGLLENMYSDGRIEKFQKQSTGLRNLSTRLLLAETITVPNDSILAAFGRIVQPLREASTIHRRESGTLMSARDLLLPRLISGQLSVEAAEQQLAAAD